MSCVLDYPHYIRMCVHRCISSVCFSLSFTSIVICLFQPPVKPKGPSFISAVALNSSSIHLIWNVSRDDNSSCVPSVFTIITSIIDNEGEVIRIDSTDVRYPLTQVVIDNLLPLKRYIFQIGMTCSNGMDSQTSEIKIRTPSPGE